VRFITLLGLFAGIFGCNHQTVPETTVQRDEAMVLKVAVFVDGRLTLNGTPASLEDLRDSLRQISQQDGAVWYYRESGQDEPPPIAMEAIQAIVDAEVPVRLSSRPDYSDAVGP